jgi:lysophospholipase L1-like esterase
MDISLNYENAISNRGNRSRIKEVMRRAMAGEALTIGFLGGSITQGSLATQPTLCYAYHVYEWWCRTFPKASFTYVNAGIGATDSQFGCARAESDLLAYEPDFVIIEFSVNDASTPHYLETYEGLVRKVYGSEKQPAVLLVHNVCYDNGANAQLMHGKVARHYELPAVSMQSCIYPELVAGRIENREITPDDLHPNDKGHALVASVITYCLDQIAEEVQEPEKPAFTALPKPLTKNAYQDSVRFQSGNSAPILTGFIKDEAIQQGITDIFKNGWMASEKGAKIEFDVEGSCIGVQYRKTMQLPAPIAKLTVDGDDEHAVLLDANFDETWGDKLVLDTVLEHGKKGMHHVVVELTETHEGDRLPFYLVSVIASGR